LEVAKSGDSADDFVTYIFKTLAVSYVCWIKLITLSFWVHVKLHYRIVSY